MTADFEHDVKVWDLNQARMELADWERRGRVSQVFICDHPALAMVSSANTAEVWDTTTGWVHGGPEAVNRDQLIRRGVPLLDRAMDSDLRERMEAILKPAVDDVLNLSAIGRLAFTPTGGRAVTAPRLPGKRPDMEEPPDTAGSQRQGGLWIWDLQHLRAVRHVSGQTGWVTCVSITADGRYALTGSQGRVLRLWDLEAGGCMRTLRGHRGMVLTCALTDDARYGISGSEDMTVRLWDLQQSRLLFTFATASAVEACDIAANGSVAIAGETSGRVHLFAVHT